MPLSFDPKEDREYTEEQARELWTEARRMAEAGDWDFCGWRFPEDPDTINFTGGFNGIKFSGNAFFMQAIFSGDADFSKTTFSEGALFSRVVFSKHADFSKVTFCKDANFTNTTFSTYACFAETTFSDHAFFTNTTFSEDADFRKALFNSDASFWTATFSKGADFSNTRFKRNADFRLRHIEIANFSGCNLQKIDLRESNLTNADIRQVVQPRWGTRTRQGDERSARSPLRLLGYLPEWLDIILMAGRPFPFVLNDTLIQSARFSSRSADPWSILRRNYSGPMFAIHLLLLVAFLLPLVSRTVFWVAAGRVQAAVAESEKAQKVVARVKTIEKKVGEIAEKVSGKQDVREEAPLEDDKHHLQWQNTRVIWALIGWHKGLLLVVLAISGVAYNALRFLLTYRVGLLRDREQQSGRSPGKSEYLWLFNLHITANYLAWLMSLFFAITLWEWLTQPVSILVY